MLKVLRLRKGIYNFAVTNQTRYSSPQLQYYQSLRIHKDKSIPSILNNLLINHVLLYDWIVDQDSKLIHLLYAICGTRLTNFIINHTIRKVFTAGENLESVETYLSLSNTKISYIMYYCSEALEGIDDYEKVQLFCKINLKMIISLIIDNLGIQNIQICTFWKN